MTWPTALNGALFVVPSHVGTLAETWRALDVAEAAGVSLSAIGSAVDAPRYRRSGTDAIVPVAGVLLNRGNMLGEFGATSYGALAAEIDKAAADPSIRRIVLDIDSGGGMASGLEDVEDAIAAARRSKPVAASVAGMAASAAYWIAAQADEIVMTRRSTVGSIGVVITHMDVSGALDRAGLKPTLIYSGSGKVDGNPFSALPAGVRADLQAHADALRQSFANAVDKGRPISASQALATEARMFLGLNETTGKSEAIEAGLADRIGTLREVLATPTARRSIAATKAPSPPAPTAAMPAGAISQPKKDPIALSPIALTPERAAAISNLPEATGREELAEHLARQTTMTVDQARKTLSQAPLAPGSHFAAGEAQAKALLKPTMSAAEAYVAAEATRAERERELEVRSAKARADYDRGVAESKALLGKA